MESFEVAPRSWLLEIPQTRGIRASDSHYRLSEILLFFASSRRKRRISWISPGQNRDEAIAWRRSWPVPYLTWSGLAATRCMIDLSWGKEPHTKLVKPLRALVQT